MMPIRIWPWSINARLKHLDMITRVVRRRYAQLFARLTRNINFNGEREITHINYKNYLTSPFGIQNKLFLHVQTRMTFVWQKFKNCDNDKMIFGRFFFYLKTTQNGNHETLPTQGWRTVHENSQLWKFMKVKHNGRHMAYIKLCSFFFQRLSILSRHPLP